MDKFTRTFSLVIFTVLGVCIGISTIIHYLAPWIFQVPSDTPPFLSTSHTLELIITDISSFIGALLIFYHSYHKYGLWRSILFLTGSFVFTGLEEAMWILLGRFGLTFPTYFFSRGGLWFFEVPFYTCVGWYIVAYTCVFLAEKLVPNPRHFLAHAAIGAFLAMDLDLWTDPVMVNLGRITVTNDVGMWVWNMEYTLKFFGIPLMNFLGWFLVIFLFALLWKVVPRRLDQWGYRKTTLIFYGCMPLLLGVCFLVLSGVEIFLIRNFFANVSIFPI